MLQHVPKYPRKITTRILNDILTKKGFEVTQRTIQRDLKALEKVMPGLQTDGGKDIPGWSWSTEGSLYDLPSMDGNVALAFKFADHFLSSMFPPSVLEQLKPYFDCADNVLETIDNTGYAHWSDKVRIVSRTQRLVPASIKAEVIPVIYEALFKGCQIRARYVRRDKDEVEYDIHPLGLIFRESVVYLIATVWEYPDPRHFALHRFKQCFLLDKKVVSPECFDLDRYLAAGNFEYCATEGEMIHLKVLFFDWAGHHLLETSLSDDQEVKEKQEGQLQVEATVKDSHQLRWWLLGFGDHVEVVEPESLRNEFAKIAQQLGEYYR